MNRTFRTLMPATITALSLTVSGATLPAVAAPTTTTAQASPAAAEANRMITQLRKAVTDARERIATKLPEANSMRTDWDDDDAFEAVTNLKQAEVMTTSLEQLLDGLDADNPNMDTLRKARALASTITSTLDKADHHMAAARAAHEKAKDNTFKCANAIDEGDDSGSSMGSSTTGLFNSTGNRIVYDDAGRPGCKTNFQFFAGKVLKFMSLMMTAYSFLSTIAKLVAPPAPPAPAPAPAAR